MNLGGRLKKARVKRGLKQEQLAARATELAKASGIDIATSQAAISALERRDSKTAEHVLWFAKALKINPEWLQTGQGESGLDGAEWRPMPADLPPDEREMLELYRGASSRWKIAIRYMAGLRNEAKQEEAGSYILSKIFATPVSDAKVAAAYGRPGAPGEHRFVAQNGESPTYKRTPSKKQRLK